MDVHEIEVTINKDGQVEVSVRGVKGQACLDLTKALEEALGGEVILREMTSEFQQENPNKLGPSLNIKGQ
jgi:hypothetical protein